MKPAARGLLISTVISLIVLAAGLSILRIRGDRLLSVQTASMVPAFRPGDAIIVRPVSLRDLRPGDVISYHSPHNPALIISHRLLSIDRRTGRLTTAGDALRVADPAFSPNLLAGRAIAVFPRFGLVLDWLRRPVGLVTAIYLPASVAIIAEGRCLFAVYAQPFYSARL